MQATGKVKAGETVLVTAAAGGLGHFAVQLAKLNGCHVIATCGSADKAQALLDLGADRVIQYKREDVDQALAAEYPAGASVTVRACRVGNCTLSLPGYESLTLQTVKRQDLCRLKY